MRTQLSELIPLGAMLLALTGCGNDSTTEPNDDPGPQIDPADFDAGAENPFFPLEPGTLLVYEGESDGEVERVEYEVTAQTKVILNVTCIVVRDRVYIDGELEEDTFDWFAHHDNGDVWYFGEDSKEIDNGEIVSTEGSWEAGVDGARPGILIKANPTTGEIYQQEYYEGEAEDMAQVVRLDASVTTPTGSYAQCLQTKEWNPLEPGGNYEFKYYARGIGLVREESVESPEDALELIEIRTR